MLLSLVLKPENSTRSVNQRYGKKGGTYPHGMRVSCGSVLQGKITAGFTVWQTGGGQCLNRL